MHIKSPAKLLIMGSILFDAKVFPTTLTHALNVSGHLRTQGNGLGSLTSSLRTRVTS